MIHHDFCLAWNWEYDAGFVGILETSCKARGLRFFQATPQNIEPTLEALERGELNFSIFHDRASEADPRFLELVFRASQHGAAFINSHEKAVHALNKASMHLEFITAGIHTPYTIILPPYEDEPHLPGRDLSPLGDSFIIKPAHGGGGEGVVIEARSFNQVLWARQEYPADYYLLQARISPARIGGRPAWFRVIYCGGRVYPCWWDTNTHVYEPVGEDEATSFRPEPLHETTQTIAEVCGLDIFSTEIALTPAGVCVVVDYVNSPIDLRLKTATFDGVPDEIVKGIAERLAELVIERLPVRPND
jgi:glutathione synthase/RimK-type ligase-like ATP-grasp enzyme